MENMNMNERLIAMMNREQETKLENAKTHMESIIEKQNQVEIKREELKDKLANMRFYQQYLISCFYDKEDLLAELKELIIDVRQAEERAKKTVVPFMYPDLNLNTLELQNDEELIDALNSACVNDFIEQLILLRSELEKIRNNE